MQPLRIPRILVPFRRFIDPPIRAAQRIFASPRIRRVVIKTVAALVAAFIVFAAAFLGYAGFYYAYIPEVKHVQPVWFQYGNGAFPTAHVDLTHHGRYAQPLRHDQAYHVSIDLNLPTSEKNLDVGNFMVTVWLRSATNQTVQFASRPTILKYRSPLSRALYTLWRAIPLVLDLSQESQQIALTIIERFYESETNPITHAVVALSDSSVQIYDAKLRLEADFRGIRYFMYYWAPLAIPFFVLVFLFWELIFGVTVWHIAGRIAGRLAQIWRKHMLSLDRRDDGLDDNVEQNPNWNWNGFETNSDVDLPLTQRQRQRLCLSKRERSPEDPSTVDAGSIFSRPATATSAAINVSPSVDSGFTGSTTSVDDGWEVEGELSPTSSTVGNLTTEEYIGSESGKGVKR